MKLVKAFAPATVANVAVGFDLLGFPIDAVGDTVSVSKLKDPIVRVKAISGSSKVPLDPHKNTATVGLLALIQDLNLSFGFEVSIRKGIPLSSGMGGSAASAVGAIVAANAFLSKPLSKTELLKYALLGEKAGTGVAHADNITPCLFGSMTIASPPGEEVSEPTMIPVPKNIICVLVHPEMELSTRTSRSVLKSEMQLKDHTRQSANLAHFIAGCYTSDLDLIERSLHDLIIEPQRKHLIIGFDQVKSAALKKGALGCSISGSGPSVFAWVSSKKTALSVKEAMTEAFLKSGIKKVNAWISPISKQGAKIIS
ncbi:MAG: homoserine kinase [Bacteriovoracaceae bacterium]|nr:homoserine kinase [Bacteriovoracaceae bacterium]